MGSACRWRSHRRWLGVQRDGGGARRRYPSHKVGRSRWRSVRVLQGAANGGGYQVTADVIQIVIGILAVGGIGGIWFRLGSLTAEHSGFKGRLDGHQARIERLEGKYL